MSHRSSKLFPETPTQEGLITRLYQQQPQTSARKNEAEIIDVIEEEPSSSIQFASRVTTEQFDASDKNETNLKAEAEKESEEQSQNTSKNFFRSQQNYDSADSSIKEKSKNNQEDYPNSDLPLTAQRFSEANPDLNKTMDFVAQSPPVEYMIMMTPLTASRKSTKVKAPSQAKLALLAMPKSSISSIT